MRPDIYMKRGTCGTRLAAQDLLHKICCTSDPCGTDLRGWIAFFSEKEKNLQFFLENYLFRRSLRWLIA